MSKPLDSKRFSRAEQNPPSLTSTQLLSPSDRRKRYDELRTRMGQGILDVKSPPGVRAIWAMCKGDHGELEMSRLDFLGFKIVKEDMKPGALKRFTASGLKADGTYVVGDVTLMEIDEEVYNLMKEIELDIFDELRRGIPAQFVDKAKGQGSPVFEVDEKNEKKFTSPTTI